MVQQIFGTLLYYSLAIEPTMLVDLGDLASTKAKETENTYEDVLYLLNSATSHPMAIIFYKKSGMVWRIHAGASHLSLIRARSQADGHHHLSKNLDDPPNNGVINTI